MKFRIEWPTGYADLNVGEFFGTANKKQVREAFRLARQYCSDADRLTLIDNMNQEIEARTKALDTCGELEYRREQTLCPFFEVLPKRPLPPQEKQLVRQRDHIEMYKEVAEKERWGSCSTFSH